jgi:phage tail-like protein
VTAPTLYRLVRDRTHWDATLAALETDADGNLTLTRLPAPPDGAPITLPPPFNVAPSGIALGPCNSVFLADAAAHCAIYLDIQCGARAVLGADSGGPPGPTWLDPCAVAVSARHLWVCDRVAARIDSFAFPALEPNFRIASGLSTPTGLATDGVGRLYVLDSGAATVLRFSAHGSADAAFDAAIAATGKLSAPSFLTLQPDGTLLVTDTHSVLAFDGDGHFVSSISGPGAPASTPWQPGALAASADRIYVADAGTGAIEVFNADGSFVSVLPGYSGAVAALAVSAAGDLYIKPGADDTYYKFVAASQFAASGTLTAGPFDAGQTQQWFRASCSVDVPANTAAQLQVFQWQADAPGPGAADWISAPTLDTLLAALVAAPPTAYPRQYIWLKVVLTSVDPATSPRLRGVRAETQGEDYRDFLPLIYVRADQQTQFLFRLLQLARIELGGVEENLDTVFRLFEADFATHSELRWLARWIALELPVIADDSQCRELIRRAVQLYRRRSTPRGLADFVEIYTGVRPTILEAFSERGIWVLGSGSRLGFDTCLPAIDPIGMVVPDPDNPLAVGAGCCPTPVGSAVVGESGPLDVTELGAPLFAEAAYRFYVFVPAYQVADTKLLTELRRVLDLEKPAHTDYHLCVVEPDMRVGFQAQLGIDTIIGGEPPPPRLDRLRLGSQTWLPSAGRIGRVGANASIGATVLG